MEIVKLRTNYFSTNLLFKSSQGDLFDVSFFFFLTLDNFLVNICVLNLIPYRKL